jgi:predicted outer membrane repeat protein
MTGQKTFTNNFASLQGGALYINNLYGNDLFVQGINV